jgi:hypothetical protein
MRILEMNNDDKFDIDLSSIDAKINDTNLFTPSEKPSVDAVNKFISTTHEFKNQSSTKFTSNFFVEYRMQVKGKYHDSGIVTSQAELQTYTVGPLIHSYPTEFIKWIYLNRKRLVIQESQKNDIDYIGYGILIPIYRIFDLYNDYFVENRLKNLIRK